MSRRRPRVAVLYNAPTLSPDHPDFASEAGVVAAARAVVLELRNHGFKAFPLAARSPVNRLVRSLTNKKPDVVFNLIEGFGGQSGGEAWITSLLELLNLPYTGCPPEAQGLCRQKARTKALLLGSGLPSARAWVFGLEDDPRITPWPGTVIVKPESEDGSLGIDQGSVVHEPGALAEQVAKVRQHHGGRALVETYLPGPEYNVGVVALPKATPLPIAEIVFEPQAGHWPILTYAAKWAAGSIEDAATPVQCPAVVESSLAARLGQLAVDAFEATGCRDVARVDFRLGADGQTMILEVNPNPDLDPSAGWARALRASGRDYGETLAALTRQA
ncbi:MAG: D-alanine--D-alanine ligase, partial [Isosphaeraceae bacterium]